MEGREKGDLKPAGVFKYFERNLPGARPSRRREEK